MSHHKITYKSMSSCNILLTYQSITIVFVRALRRYEYIIRINAIIYNFIYTYINIIKHRVCTTNAYYVPSIKSC